MCTIVVLGQVVITVGQQRRIRLNKPALTNGTRVVRSTLKHLAGERSLK